MTALQVHESDAIGHKYTAEQRSSVGHRKDAVRYHTKSANSFIEAACLMDSFNGSVTYLLRARKQLQQALDEVEEYLKQER
jgi:hypothetical protein